MLLKNLPIDVTGLEGGPTTIHHSVTAQGFFVSSRAMPALSGVM
jgi:hypothetical protein